MSTDSTVNFGNVVGGSNAKPGAVNVANVYARWTGYLVPSVSGKYTLGTNSDDGINLFIGDTPIIQALSVSLTANGTTSYNNSGTIELTAGVFYPLTLEWQHGTGTTYQVQLLWTPPGGSVAVIPSANLSTSKTSVTGNLHGDWWNGTTGLWFPNGPGIIDFANSQNVNKNLDNLADTSTYIRQPTYALVRVPNGNFEASSSILPPPGWENQGSPALAYETGSPQSGNRSLKVTGTIGTGVRTIEFFKVVPGEIYRLSGYIKGDGTSRGNIVLAAVQANGVTETVELDLDAGNPSPTSWTFVSGNVTIPANSVAMKIFLEQIASSSSSCYFDNITCIKVYDPSTGEFAAKGSTPPNLSTAFTFNTTTTSITITWTSLTIYRADGTTTTPANSSATITGLTAGTTYFFWPYYDEATQAVSFVTGGSGSPTYAFTSKANAQAQAQALFGHIPLSQSALQVSTPASGTTSGGGGGSGSCVWDQSLVQHRERGIIRVADCKVGDYILGRHKWNRITAIADSPCDTWVNVHLAGERLRVSPSHKFTLADGTIKEAQHLCLSDAMLYRTGAEIRIAFPDGLIPTFEPGVKRMLILDHEHDETCPADCDPGTFFAGTFYPRIFTHNFILGT